MTDELTEIRSPYRPFPLGAKKDLRRAVDTLEFDEEDTRVAFVSEIPSNDLLDKWELHVVRTDDPEEVWVTKSGDRIEIYSDRVERDGVTASIDPDEARESARESEYFTRESQAVDT